MQLRSLVSAAPLALAMVFASASPAPAASFALLAPPHVTPDVARGPRIYKLPFPAGVTFTMCQGNNQGSHTGHGRYAWDFCMPIGTPVTASRGGTVKFLRQEFTQAGQGPAFADKNNYVVVDHGDGTSAMYMHLMHNGVRVRIGQHVDPGQLLAYSGNTGWSSGPHTHFMIMQSSPYDWYAQSLPVAFADVPENGGVPRNGDRVTSGNAPLDASLILAPCERGAVATASFKPYWVESFKPSSVWSGPDDKAVRFGPTRAGNSSRSLPRRTVLGYRCVCRRQAARATCPRVTSAPAVRRLRLVIAGRGAHLTSSCLLKITTLSDVK